MVAVVCVGGQWGDEGKGKVVDVLSQNADLVVRFRAGKKTGHTVFDGEHRYLLHSLPAGVLREQTKLIIANDTFVDPEALIQEIELFELRHKKSLKGRLFVSEHAITILDYHKRIEKARREASNRGLFASDGDIFRLAEDDISHAHGIRLGDYLLRDEAPQMMRAGILYANSILDAIGAELYKGTEIESILARLKIHREKLAPYITNTTRMVRDEMDMKNNVVFEGARGSLKDSHFGSSLQPLSLNLAAQAAARSAFGLNEVNHVLLIAKPYCTRFGRSHFASEMPESLADKIRESLGEFEISSQREKRCGWLDIPALLEAKRANGATHLALTKLDILASLEQLRLCVAYNDNDNDNCVFEENTAVYEEFKNIGYMDDLPESMDDLPEPLRKYIGRIEELLGVPVIYLSFGENRNQTIYKPLF